MGERVVCVGSHIDDIEIGCGGTLLKHRSASDSIHLVVLKADEEITSRAIVRQQEQWKSCEKLGLSPGNLHLFGKGVNIEDVVAQLDRINPTVLYFPWEHDYHQDHAIASQVGFAVSRNTQIMVLKYLTPTSHSYYPNYLSVIDIEKKKQLVAVFKSQMERRPKFMEVMEAQNRFFGSLIPGDGHYAEGFVLHRQVKF
jgi:LmbE family N-acetylglucosaminyl deacetylase